MSLRAGDLRGQAFSGTRGLLRGFGTARKPGRGYIGHMRQAVTTGLFLLATVACGVPGPPDLRYAHFTQPAGSKIAYVDVRRHWTEHLTVDGSRERWNHFGVLAIDLETFTTRFEKGRSFSVGRRQDRFGREFYAEYVEGGDDKPLRTALWMRDAARSILQVVPEGT